jgi:Holliday junction resolvase RusA-like endonuclease
MVHDAEILPLPRLDLFLRCIPPKASHHQKAIVTIRTKAGDEFHKLADKAPLRAARQLYAGLLSGKAPRSPIPSPVGLLLEFTWPWRAGDSQRTRALGRIWKETSPDNSNLAKTLEDVLCAMGFIENDGQVGELVVRKFLGDSPGVGISIRTLEGARR